MKVEVVQPGKHTVKAVDMEIGEIGRVVAGEDERALIGYLGHIVLKAFDYLISLSKPSDTWRVPSHGGPDFEIEVLKPGTQVVLTVE